MKKFYAVLLNTLIANVTTSFLWFAITFWLYIETQSVLVTAMIGGSYMLLVALLSLIFGTIVDRHKKKRVMLFATVVTLAAYLLGGVVYLLFEKSELLSIGSIGFWLFILVILVGAVVENMRNIALSTVVTLLVPEKQHAQANGLVGTVTGMAFLVTSVFSGLAIGFLGMGWTLVIAIILTAVSTLHLFFVSIPEEKIMHDPELDSKKVDIKGGIQAIKAIPGLMALILFTTFNNLLGGVYMALMDPYGLTLFSPQIWGIVLGVTSAGFVFGGLLIAKFGLGKKPIKTLLLVNVVMWIISILFVVREAWILYVVGIFIWMLLVPMAEATEQTVIQKVVPFKKQGRVFGLAQAVESSATPITAFLIGPIAEFWVIPYMKSPEGQQSFGWLLGPGQARGIALVFIAAGVIGLVITVLAFFSKSYVRLSQYFAKA